MKIKSCIAWAIALAAIVVGTLSASAATLSTGFSYQGRLFDGGSAANGQYEMEFVLRDQALGGNQVGTNISITQVTVTNGLFQVTVDFGTNVWDGNARWLDVSVRTNGSTSPHTLLTPSQLIQPVPYAVHSIKAGELVGTLPSTQLSGSYPNPVTLNNAANAFGGNGSGLTSLNAAQLATGTVPDARLDATVTRDSELLSVSNALSGQLTANNSSALGIIMTTSNGLDVRLVATNGALLGFLDATNTALMSKITTTSNELQTAIDNEVAARAALATMLQTGDNVFAGSNHFSGITLLTNTANVFAGDGSELTLLDASQLASGTVPDARLSGAIARTADLVTVSNNLNALGVDSQMSNSFLGQLILTTDSNLRAALDATNMALMGKITTTSNGLQVAIDNEAAARAALTTMLQTGDNSFAGSNHFSGITLLTNSANVLAGNGSLLTALNADQITSGTVADARIDSALARDSEMLSVSNALDSQISSQNSALLGTITTTSNGLDARLVATNSALIGFLDATNTALMSKITTTSNELQTAIDNEAAARGSLVTMLQTGDNAFAGSNHFSGIVFATNTGNMFTGDGSGLTSLDGSQVTSGTVADARIDAALARDSEVLSVSNALNGQISSQNSSLLASITTTSNGLDARLVATNSVLIGFLDATNTALMSEITTTSNDLQTAIDGEASARASLTTMLQSGDNAFAGSNHFSGITLLTNTANFLAGNGSGLTALNADQITSGTLAEARIDSALARDSEMLSVSNALDSQISSQSASLLGTIATTSNGLDARLVATNSALIGFLDATNTALMAKITTASNALDVAIANEAAARASLVSMLQTGNNAFAGSNHFSGILVATNLTNELAGTFTGDGSGLSNVAVASLTGTLSSSQFAGTYSQDVALAGQNVHSGSNHFSGIATLTNTANAVAGNGSGLTALNAGNLSSGTVDDTRLSGNVALTTNSVVFSGTVGGTGLIIGTGHALAGTGSSIAGGLANSIDVNSTNSFIGGGTDNTITNSIQSVIVSGAGNTIPEDSHVGFIGGGMGNSFSLGQYGVIVGGVSNMAGGEASYNFVGGGDHNTAWNSGSAVVGGRTNYAGGTDAFIGGGRKNTTGAGYATVSGGRQNTASSQYAFVGGGYSNKVSAQYGIAPGGYSNTVAGTYGFAAGRRARAAHNGAFVWADSTDADFVSAAANTFNVRANGGVSFTTGGSGFAVDGNSVLTTASVISSSQLSGTYSQNLTLSGTNTYAGSNHFSGLLVATNANNELAGDGSSLSGLWKTAGNSGTTPGSDFLGTTDNQDLVFKANNLQIARFTPAPDEGAPNVLLGAEINSIKSGIYGATIGGGGATTFMNEGSASNAVNANYSTIGGGVGNLVGINGYAGTIGGGIDNIISTNADRSTIAGGTANEVDQDTFAGTIAGGSGNYLAVDTDYATIAGGRNNSADSQFATVAGGNGNSVSGLYGFVGGGNGNNLTSSADYAGVASGSNNDIPGAKYAFIGGGQNNTIDSGSDKAAMGGGIGNTIKSSGAFIGSGFANLIDTATATWSFIGAGANNAVTGTSDSAVIGGGQYNTNSGSYGVIGGGLSNRVTSTHAVVPGGANNQAGGAYSFAAGRNARANHDGTFVWADSNTSNFVSRANNTFNVRAMGGIEFTAANRSDITINGVRLMNILDDGFAQSSRKVKKNFAPLDTVEVLEKLSAMPIEHWQYKKEDDGATPHMGPYAEDFKGTFYPGRDDSRISWMEFHGVELAAIQGLNQKLESKLKKKDEELSEMRKELDALKELVMAMQKSGGAQ